jgi:hypothetical protein
MEYGKWIKQSARIARTQKWLWIPASLVASSSFSNFQSTLRSAQKYIPKDKPAEEVVKQTSQVLGTTTSNIIQSLASVPASVYLLLVFAILAVIIVTIVVRLIINAWAVGALLGGIQIAISGKDVGLVESSAYAVTKMRSFIKYSVYSGLLYIGIVVGFLISIFALIVIMTSNLPGGIKFIGGFGSIALVVVCVITMLALFISSSYAVRYVLYKGAAPLEAIKSGLGLLRQNIGPTLVVSIINFCANLAASIVAIPLVFIPAGILALPLIVPIISGHTPTIANIVSGGTGGIVGFIIGSIFAAVVMAIVHVFQQSMWTLLFNTIHNENN